MQKSRAPKPLQRNLIPTGQANAQGFWSIAVVGVLDDGFHEITAVATLPGQTPSAHSPPLALVVDTAAPDPPTAPVLSVALDTGLSAMDGITSKNVLQFTARPSRTPSFSSKAWTPPPPPRARRQRDQPC